MISQKWKKYSPDVRVIDNLYAPDTFDTCISQQASANLQHWVIGVPGLLPIGLWAWKVTCPVSKKICLSQTTEQDHFQSLVDPQ